MKRKIAYFLSFITLATVGYGVLHYRYDIFMSLSNVEKQRIKFENNKAYFKGEHFSSRTKEEVGDLVKIYSYDEGQLDGLYVIYNKVTKRYKEIGSYSNNKQHGTYKQYFDNGFLADDSYFFQGGRDGITKIYYDNGALRGIINYSDGKRQGHATQYYKNGKTMFEHNYHKDLLHGISTDYYTNGNKKSTVTYVNGQQQGKYTLYHTNGAVKEVGTIIKDKKNGPFAIYDNKQRQIIVGRFFNGKLDGKITYTLNNNWKESREFKNGIQDGLVETFDEKGRKRGVMNFVNGIAHGDYESYDEEGNVDKSGFLDNSKILERMQKDKEEKERAAALLKKQEEEKERAKKEALEVSEIILDTGPQVLKRENNALSNTVRVHTVSSYNKKDNDIEEDGSSTIDINKDNITFDSGNSNTKSTLTQKEAPLNNQKEILNTEIVHDQALDGSDVLQQADTPSSVKLDSIKDVSLSQDDVEITLDGSYLSEDGVDNMLDSSQTQSTPQKAEDKYKSINKGESTDSEAQNVIDINITR